MEEGKRIFLVFLLGVSLCVVGGLVFLLIKVRRSRLLREEKDKDKSKQIQQVRLFGYSFKNQLGGGERYHHIARFLQIWSMLSLLSALGWLVRKYDNPQNNGGNP